MDGIKLNMVQCYACERQVPEYRTHRYCGELVCVNEEVCSAYIMMRRVLEGLDPRHSECCPCDGCAHFANLLAES